MKLKKRKKIRRMRGTRLHGFAAKKHKGKGNKGGKGMAGTGKRGDQKKSKILVENPNYFGKRGFKSKRKKLKAINLNYIEKLIEEKGKKTERGVELDLRGYKILSMGDIKKKPHIKVSAISKQAKEKIEKIGGSVEIIKRKEIKKEVKKLNKNGA